MKKRNLKKLKLWLLASFLVLLTATSVAQDDGVIIGQGCGPATIGTHSFSFDCTLINSTTNEKIIWPVDVTYTFWPKIVGVSCKSLYTPPLPNCPIRLPGIVRGRSVYGWFDVWDGYIGPDGVRHGCRCYETDTATKLQVDCRKYPLYSFVIVDGWTDRLGRLYVTSVQTIGMTKTS